MKNTKLFLLTLLVILGALFTVKFWGVLMLFLVSIIFAYLLMPPVRLLTEKLKMKRGLAVAVVMLVVFVIIVTIISISIPMITAQVRNLTQAIQLYAKDFDDLISKSIAYLAALRLPEPVLETLHAWLAQGDVYIASFLNGFATGLLSLTTRMLDGVVVAVVTVYFMLDGGKMLRSFVNTLPIKSRLRIERVVASTDTITRDYIRSKCLIALGMSIVTYIGLSIIGVPYALLFAILSFVLDFIPYFGSIIAGAVEAFFALITGGVTQAIIVAVFVLIVQQIEGNVVAPKIQGNLSGLHPVIVMLAILVANKVWGPLGMLIAVPIAGLCKLVISEVYQYIVSPDEPASISDTSTL